MEIRKELFGEDANGTQVELLTLKNTKETQVKISTLGATVVSFLCLDKSGNKKDIVLGYEDASGYVKGSCYIGATVGRSANRIRAGKMTIHGTEYDLEKNDVQGEGIVNNLHSGSNGMSGKVWEIDKIDEAANSVTLKCFSADKEQDFPGNMTAKVTFALDEENALSITYEAVSDQDTVANFTNHSYFNLKGHDGGSVYGQKLKIYADAFTPLVPVGAVPTGEIRPVEGTPFDFREFKEIGKDAEADYDQLRYANGYDHNFVLDEKREVRIMAEALCEETGIHLYAYTDCPGVQLYAANFVENEVGKDGVVYNNHHGFCLESQYFPNAINEPDFESPLLKAGETYTSVTIFKVGLD